MLDKVKGTLVRLHLPTGDVIEALPDEIASSPPLGSFSQLPDGRVVPNAPGIVIVHKIGETTQRRFIGPHLVIEIVEEEQLIETPLSSSFTRV